MSEIRDHLPDYYDGVLEAEEIMKSDDFAIDLIDAKVAKSFLNMYVLHADDEGLHVLETTYHIAYNTDLSLETRRYNLIMRLLPPKPITLRYFKELLNAVAIKADLDVNAIASTFVAKLDAANVKPGQTAQLSDMMQTYLPAHLAQKIYQLSYYTSNINNFIGVANNLLVNGFSMCRDDITSFETEARSYIGVANELRVHAVSICRDVVNSTSVSLQTDVNVANKLKTNANFKI